MKNDLTSLSDKQGACINNMRLFGLPYQFTGTVDQRYPGVSETVGRSYITHIMHQAPVCYIIPGEPVFLPGVNGERKDSLVEAFLKGAVENVNVFKDAIGNRSSDKVRFYDFSEAYSEYMKYVNIMCRTAAAYMELGTQIRQGNKYVSLQQYDWKNYRWNRDSYEGAALGQASYIVGTTLSNIGGIIKKVQSGFTGQAVTGKGEMVSDSTPDGRSNDWSCNYVQFYCDPSSGSSQSMGNSTSQSQIKSALDNIASATKEFQFVTQSTGVETEGLEQVTSGAIDALRSVTNGWGVIGKMLDSIATVGKTIVHGENLVLPEIYQTSDYGIDYTITMHFRTPYGNKLGTYMDVVAPLCHVLGLVCPRQGTANTHGSPFLVKVYCPGNFNCNLGIVESVTITRPSSEDAWSNDRLPTEIEVTLRIKDLYSELALSPSNDPELFANNSSLIDYLATISGVSLIEPQLDTRFDAMVSNRVNWFRDIPANVGSAVNDWLGRKFTGMVTL